MRTDRAIDAWRKVLELDPADFRALAALETLFTQEGRWEECVDVLERRARGAGQPRGPGRRPHAGGQHLGRQDRRRRRGGRGLRAHPGHRPGQHDASTELEQLYRQRKSWMKLVELLLSRTEFLPTPRSASSCCVQIAEIYEQQLGDRDSAFVTLQAAFREDYSNDHVAKRAGAAGHRGRQVERAARRLHPGGADHRRRRSRRRTCG